MPARRRVAPTPEELRLRLAANLTRVMAEQNVDADELARRLGLPPHGARNLGKYMRGEKWPREETVSRWCEALAVDPVEFFRPTA